MASAFAGARFGATRMGRRGQRAGEHDQQRLAAAATEHGEQDREHAELRAAATTTQGVLVNSGTSELRLWTAQWGQVAVGIILLAVGVLLVVVASAPDSAGRAVFPKSPGRARSWGIPVGAVVSLLLGLGLCLWTKVTSLVLARGQQGHGQGQGAGQVVLWTGTALDSMRVACGEGTDECGEVLLRTDLVEVVTARGAGLGLATAAGARLGRKDLQRMGVTSEGDDGGQGGATAGRYKVGSDRTDVVVTSATERRQDEDAAWWLVLVVGAQGAGAGAGAGSQSSGAAAAAQNDEGWTGLGADNVGQGQQGGQDAVMRAEGAEVQGIVALPAWSQRGARDWSAQVRGFLLGAVPTVRGGM